MEVTENNRLQQDNKECPSIDTKIACVLIPKTHADG